MNSITTLAHFDEAIAAITENPTGKKDVDELCEAIAQTVAHLKKGQVNLINELLEMYDSASEHNVDIGRRAIFQLAQRLASVNLDTTTTHDLLRRYGDG